MSSLQELGLAGEDDDEWMAALASPVDRFLEETKLSVQAYGALDRVADDLGAQTLRQLCTRQADALLRRRAGRRGWREVVDGLADWLEQRVDDPDPDADLDEPVQASLFGPPGLRVV